MAHEYYDETFQTNNYPAHSGKHPSLPIAQPKPELFMPSGADQGEPFACSHDPETHCLTCSDEAVEVTIISIDANNGLALVEVEQQTEEVDITLLECLLPGDKLLVHGGVAIQKLA